MATLAIANVHDGGLRLHVDTVDDGMIVGDTIVTYGAVTGFNALVIGDVEYEIKPGSVHRIKRGVPHGVFGEGTRQLTAIDEITRKRVGSEKELPLRRLVGCCEELEVTFRKPNENSTLSWGEDNGGNFKNDLTTKEPPNPAATLEFNKPYSIAVARGQTYTGVVYLTYQRYLYYMDGDVPNPIYIDGVAVCSSSDIYDKCIETVACEDVTFTCKDRRPEGRGSMGVVVFVCALFVVLAVFTVV